MRRDRERRVSPTSPTRRYDEQLHEDRSRNRRRSHGDLPSRLGRSGESGRRRSGARDQGFEDRPRRRFDRRGRQRLGAELLRLSSHVGGGLRQPRPRRAGVRGGPPPGGGGAPPPRGGAPPPFLNLGGHPLPAPPTTPKS